MSPPPNGRFRARRLPVISGPTPQRRRRRHSRSRRPSDLVRAGGASCCWPRRRPRRGRPGDPSRVRHILLRVSGLRHDVGVRGPRATLAVIALLPSAGAGWSCHSTKSSTPAPVTATSGSTHCPPTGLAGDGQRQRTEVNIGGVGLGPPPTGYSPSADAKAARSAADFLVTGATSVRTVLASVSGPPPYPTSLAWTVVGCHVPFVSKGPPPGASGFATIVAPVDATTGRLIFSITVGE